MQLVTFPPKEERWQVLNQNHPRPHPPGPRAATVRFRPGSPCRPRSARPMVRYLGTTSPVPYHRCTVAITGSLWTPKVWCQNHIEPISLMKTSIRIKEWLICPDMSCRSKEVKSTARVALKYTLRIQKTKLGNSGRLWRQVEGDQ